MEVLREIEAVEPAVLASLEKSKFGKDAVQKAQGVVLKARSAIASQDSATLASLEESLQRTLQLFKGLVGMASKPGKR